MADSVQTIEAPHGATGLPPLRIHHFMIWTALTAVIICGCMMFDRLARNGPPIRNPVIIGALIVIAVVVAGVLTIGGSAIQWRRQGGTFPRSPGDLLVISIASAALAYCVTIGLLLAIFLISGGDDWFFAFYLIVGVTAAIGWSYLQILGFRYSTTWPWRVVFLVLLIGPWIIGLSPLAVVLAFIASVLCAAWVDWRKCIQRNWTHWCGILFAILLGISLLCIIAIVT